MDVKIIFLISKLLFALKGGILMKNFCGLIIIAINIIFLSGCQNIDTEELTTQPRDYEETVEIIEDNKISTEINSSDDVESNQPELNEGVFRSAYPDVDFEQKIIPMNDENVVSYLTLKERYIDDNEISYNEGGRYEEYPFHIKINSAYIIAGKDKLDDYFKNCERLNDSDYIDFFGESVINNSNYININITIRNESKDSREVNMNNKRIEIVHDEIGIYRISDVAGEYIDTDYVGSNRGTAKAGDEIIFASGEEITMNVVFMLKDGANFNSLYYNVNGLYRSGEIYDDGTWHADSEGAPNIIKINVDKE